MEDIVELYNDCLAIWTLRMVYVGIATIEASYIVIMPKRTLLRGRMARNGDENAVDQPRLPTIVEESS